MHAMVVVAEHIGSGAAFLNVLGHCEIELPISIVPIKGYTKKSLPAQSMETS